MSIGINGVSIAPELGIHFHAGSLSFFERCCGSKQAAMPEINDQIYIDEKLRAQRWQDKKACNGVSVTHARLKLIVIERLHKISQRPFEDAERSFQMANILWEEPRPIFTYDLQRLNSAVAKISQSILNDPLEIH